MTNKVDYKPHLYLFRRLLCVILSFVFLISLVPVAGAVSTIPTPESIKAQIRKTYKDAQTTTGYKTFDGYCAHYVNTQLKLLKINKGYVGGNGNDEYDNYKNLSYSTGGYKIHAYDVSDYTLPQAMKHLAAKYSCITNILVGFQKTGTSAGKKYGHAHFIHAIIDGYVYMSESVNATLGGEYFPEGSPIVATIDDYCAKYNNGFYEFEGVIWFEDEELTALMGGEIGSGSPDIVPTPPQVGEHYINTSSGLRLRAGPSTKYDTLDVIDYKEIIYIVEIGDGWGRTFYNGFEGWVSLDYVTYNGALPAVCAETRKDGKLNDRSFYADIDSALNAYKDGEYSIILNADATLASDLVLSDGISINIGEHKLDTSKAGVTFDGGTLVSASRVESLDADPFIKRTDEDKGYSYSSGLDFELSAEMPLGGGIAFEITANVNGFSNIKGAGLEFIIKYADGTEEVVSADVKNDSASVIAKGITAKKIKEAITVTARAYAKADGKTYERFSDTVSYRPTAHLIDSYGNSAKFDRIIAGLLNYASASQKYFGYNTSDLANSILPEDAREIQSTAADAIRAEAAPAVLITSAVHINSVQLVLDDSIALRFGISDMVDGADVQLLVWTDAEYRELVKNAKSSGKSISDIMDSVEFVRIAVISNVTILSFIDLILSSYPDSYSSIQVPIKSS